MFHVGLPAGRSRPVAPRSMGDDAPAPRPAVHVLHPFTAEIANLAVDPAYQRRGIATDLIFHALRRAREAGHRRIEIATGDTSRGPLRLYRSFGFEPVEVERDYFPKYYPAPIVEAGEECRDLVRLRMEL
ncbi:MAG: GNAT family N-acetyltransferase [Alistipes sp.]|nr:GNAT family N-acetyltransferase [Alistipes sp.]